MELGWCAPGFLHKRLVHASLSMQKYTDDIPQGRDNSLLHTINLAHKNSHTKKEKTNAAYHGQKTQKEGFT